MINPLNILKPINSYKFHCMFSSRNLHVHNAKKMNHYILQMVLKLTQCQDGQHTSERRKTTRSPWICQKRNAYYELWSCCHQILSNSHDHHHCHSVADCQKNRTNQFDLLGPLPRLQFINNIVIKGSLMLNTKKRMPDE